MFRDVATVVDGFAETDQLARFDDEPTMLISVFRTGDQSALEIVSLVYDYVDRAQRTVPAEISVAIWQDTGEILQARLSLMLRNGATGFVLVFVLLALFLEVRLAFWVSLGIPISFLGAIVLMPMLDVTVNIMSLFAFILVLGIVVDDAIIVGENIYSHQERHGDTLRGSIEGAQEIATPVIFAVLTTVAAFVPLMFVAGIMGKFFKVIPLIVVPCLLFSLLESLNILPAHLAHLKKRRPGPWGRFQGRFAKRAQVVHSLGLSTAARGIPSLAIRHGRSGGLHADRDGGDGARGLGHLPVLSLGRSRFHVGGGHDAARHAARGDIRCRATTRGRSRAHATGTNGRDRAGLLPSCFCIGR